MTSKMVYVLATFLVSCSLLSGQKEISFLDHLEMMTDLDQLFTPLVPQEKSIMFSSFDRNCEKGLGVQEAKPWDPKGWYANIDRDWYLREESRNNKTEYVLADIQGPGAIVRLWSANPTGTLFFYLDGSKEPTWSVDFKGLLSGKVSPLVEPMAGVRGRGYNFHLPIPFSKQVKLTCSKNDHHYHVNVRLYPKNYQVESFSPGLLGRHGVQIKETGSRLLLGPDLEKLEEKFLTGSICMTGYPEDPSEWAYAEMEVTGPMVIREIALKIEPKGKCFLDRANLLRRILFCIDHEGRRAVRVPVSDFFASVPNFNAYQTYPMGVTKEGEGVCRFPIPIKNKATIQLVADGPLPEVNYSLRIKTDKKKIPENSLTFRASWGIRKQIRTRPFSDFRVLNAQGPGRFVGLCLCIANPTPYWWGEGDEKFFVDGESFPSTFGTGTEDYFGYAWADPNFFTSPYHSQPQCDGPDNYGYTCLNRFHVHDAIPFQSSFLFDLEIWHWRDLYMDYATCAYWYGTPGASHGLAFMPEYTHRTVDEIGSDRVFRARDAIEGEDLMEVKVSGGQIETPLMGWYSDRKWSHEKHLFWKGAKPDDTLCFTFDAKKEGLHKIEAVFTQARDYAIIQVSVNDQNLGDPIDCFTPHVVKPCLRKNLGQCALKKGKNRFQIRIIGHHRNAVPNFLVGLDYLRVSALD